MEKCRVVLRRAVGLLLPGSPVVCEGGWGVSPRYALDSRWYLPGRGFTSKAAEALADAVARSLFTRLEDEGLHAPGVFSGEGPAHGDLSARDGLLNAETQRRREGGVPTAASPRTPNPRKSSRPVQGSLCVSAPLR